MFIARYQLHSSRPHSGWDQLRRVEVAVVQRWTPAPFTVITGSALCSSEAVGGGLHVSGKVVAAGSGACEARGGPRAALGGWWLLRRVCGAVYARTAAPLAVAPTALCSWSVCAACVGVYHCTAPALVVGGRCVAGRARGTSPFPRDGLLSAARPASGYGASYPPCMHGARGRGVRGRLPGGSHFQGFVCLLFFGRRAELLLLFWCGFPGPCLRGCSWSECNADTARSVTLRRKGGRVQPHPQG